MYKPKFLVNGLTPILGSQFICYGRCMISHNGKFLRTKVSVYDLVPYVPPKIVCSQFLSLFRLIVFWFFTLSVQPLLLLLLSLFISLVDPQELTNPRPNLLSAMDWAHMILYIAFWNRNWVFLWPQQNITTFYQLVNSKSLQS